MADLLRLDRVAAGYGEALVGVAGNKVTDEAKRHFDQALAAV